VYRRPETGMSSSTWWKVVIFVIAFGFLAGAVGWYVAQPSPPAEGSVDVGFFRDMTYHHEQAVEMALYEQANGSDPVTVDYANEILRRQSFELGVMSTKLDEWGYASSPAENAMAWMNMPVPVDQMPGLATKDQMRQLRDARGGASDKLFLELMSQHHRGGVHMADYAYRNASSASVREIAQRMAYVQATEVNEFRDTASRNHIDANIPPQEVTVPDPSAGQNPE
jgi:uncharacterized protein (DUF305 family)